MTSTLILYDSTGQWGWLGELYGLDLHEHGISAYPEYVISALGAPRGMNQELPTAHSKSSLATTKPLSHIAS